MKKIMRKPVLMRDGRETVLDCKCISHKTDFKEVIHCQLSFLLCKTIINLGLQKTLNMTIIKIM